MGLRTAILHLRATAADWGRGHLRNANTRYMNTPNEMQGQKSSSLIALNESRIVMFCGRVFEPGEDESKNAPWETSGVGVEHVGKNKGVYLA